ncbi:MAG: hypothetical protein ACI9KN_002140, partial [Gammaproteobacteria bacterium]
AQQRGNPLKGMRFKQVAAPLLAMTGFDDIGQHPQCLTLVLAEACREPCIHRR